MVDKDLVRRCELVESAGFASVVSDVSDSARHSMGMSCVWVAGTPVVRAQGAPGWTLFNRTIALGLTNPVGTADLDQIEAFFGGGKHAIEASPLADGLTPETLEQRGYQVEARRPKFVRRSTPNPLPVGVEIHVAEPVEAPALAVLMAECFGMPPTFHKWIASVIETPCPGRATLVATLEGQAVGSGFVFTQDGIGWLGGGCCHPDYRGRGVQCALIEGRAAWAKGQGAEWVTAETNPDTPESPNYSCRNMVRSGFEMVFERPTYVAGTGPEPEA